MASPWLRMTGVSMLVGLSLLFLALRYGGTWPLPALEVLTTLGSVLLALSATMFTVHLQQTEAHRRWRNVLLAELEQMLDILERKPRGDFRIALPGFPEIVFELPSMTPILFQDGVKSGHFDKQVSKDLLYLVAKIDSYNLRLNRFVGLIQQNFVIPVNAGKVLYENWTAELKHLNDQKTDILGLCQSLVKAL